MDLKKEMKLMDVDVHFPKAENLRMYNDHNINHQLIEAIEDYDVDKVITLLEEGANPNYRTDDQDTPLIVVTKKGGDEVNRLKIVKALLDRGAEPNVQDQQGISPLMDATMEGDYDMVKELLERGADPNQQDEMGWTVLMFVAKYGDLNILRELLDRGANPDLQNESGMTALMLAAKQGWYLKDTIKELLDRGADRDLRNNDGKTALDLIKVSLTGNQIRDVRRVFAPNPNLFKADTKTLRMNNDQQLIKAIDDYDADKVITLLGEGANPNYRTEDQDTPLIAAAKRGGDEEDGVKTVKALLDRGADPNVEDQEGISPLMHAIMEGNYHEMVMELLERGANPNHQDKTGWTPLMLVAGYGDLGIIRELLDRGANPDLQNENDMTALMLAAQQGWRLKDAIKELLDRGANRVLRNRGGKTAFDLLKMKTPDNQIRDMQRLFAPNPAIIDPETGISNLAIVASQGTLDLLEDVIDNYPGFDIDYQDRDGNTALIFTIVNGPLEHIAFLLDRGADPNLANFGGGTPLAYANELNRDEVVKMLTDAGAK